MPKRKCVHCGKVNPKHRAESLHCSDRCKWDAEKGKVGHCATCGILLTRAKMRHHAQFCSRPCGVAAHKKRYQSLNPTPNLPSGTVGAISEYRVVCDLMSKGTEVFRATSPCCSADLVLLFDHRLVSVEVRTGHYSKFGVPYKITTNIRADVLALVLPDKIVYEPQNEGALITASSLTEKP